jgi:hypothetical protein
MKECWKPLSNGRADALVTCNARDFGIVAIAVRNEVLLPPEAIRRINRTYPLRLPRSLKKRWNGCAARMEPHNRFVAMAAAEKVSLLSKTRGSFRTGKRGRI